MSSSNVTPIDGLDELRKGLTPGHRKIVRAYIRQVERDFIEALPELNEGVNTSAAQGSFSATFAIKKAKHGRFSGTLSCRVRTPREPTEFDFYVSDDRQLELGLPPGWDPKPDGSE